LRLSTLIPLLLLHLPASIWSAEPPGYYAAAQGLSGPALRTALHNIIRHTQSLPYSAPAGTFDTSDALMVLDHSLVRFVLQKTCGNSQGPLVTLLAYFRHLSAAHPE